MCFYKSRQGHFGGGARSGEDRLAYPAHIELCVHSGPASLVRQTQHNATESAKNYFGQSLERAFQFTQRVKLAPDLGLSEVVVTAGQTGH